jgi:hypothetical protein
MTPPIGWLEDYWMGRYYGFIEAPTTNVSELPPVQSRAASRGAASYNGSPRPVGKWEK